MRLAAALALSALLAASAQADTDGGGSPEFVRRYALDAVRHYTNRGYTNTSADVFTGLKYFTKKSPQPFWAVLPRQAAARLAVFGNHKSTTAQPSTCQRRPA
jgi:hypothetical protein